MDQKASLPAANALTAASRRRRICRNPKEFAASQIILVTYCKLSEAISTGVFACSIHYHVTVTPLLRVNEQFSLSLSHTHTHTHTHTQPFDQSINQLINQLINVHLKINQSINVYLNQSVNSLSLCSLTKCVCVFPATPGTYTVRKEDTLTLVSFPDRPTHREGWSLGMSTKPLFREGKRAWYTLRAHAFNRPGISWC